jgi:hypothetical protein
MIGVVLSVVAQTIGLIMLSFGRLERFNRPAPIVAGIVIAGLAITFPVLTCPDVFFYSYVSSIGRESYSAVSVPSNSPYSFLSAHMPLTGNIYGPLWTAFDVAVGSLGRSFHDKIFAFRIANAILLLAAALAVRVMRYSRRVQLAFVLNPMLWFYFVTNAHNDIFAITLCFFAVAAVRRHPWLAVLLVAGAGAYKISYLLMGSFAFLRIRSRKTSLALTCSAVAIALSVSWLTLGQPYLSQLTGYAHGSHPDDNGTVKLVVVALAIVALGIAANAIFARRMQPAAAWVFPLASPTPFPWYFIWGLPYAAVVRRGFGTTLLLLPVAAALGDQVFVMDAIAWPICCTTIILVVTDLLFRSIRRRQATALTSS